jgi:hypothetical protein
MREASLRETHVLVAVVVEVMGVTEGCHLEPVEHAVVRVEPALSRGTVPALAEKGSQRERSPT